MYHPLHDFSCTVLICLAEMFITSDIPATTSTEEEKAERNKVQENIFNQGLKFYVELVLFSTKIEQKISLGILNSTVKKTCTANN
jgi:hypothetical protein